MPPPPVPAENKVDQKANAYQVAGLHLAHAKVRDNNVGAGTKGDVMAVLTVRLYYEMVRRGYETKYLRDAPILFRSDFKHLATYSDRFTFILKFHYLAILTPASLRPLCASDALPLLR
ncbi:hypothetical protein D9756_010581 [Leucocoprinus leucothites]|uniref:Uncharacterized protein n=1 Tax=Leucocoprinus leucothites TaxID=201217 RepID=A0A8H5CS03_9AGAR|nr:hypothetical protein D9756_011299 [Leucoagaricus leucothites]KAF5346835.1 hypothetical protein D9756_010581 [Leucoagaricus leucothites]